MPKFKSSLFMISLSFALVACGGGGNSSSPISNNPTEVNITCNKGIPSKTSGLTNIGLYVEPLYYLDAIYPVKYDDTGTQTDIFVSLYENTLTDGILYEQLTQLNHVDTSPNVFYKKIWKYSVTDQGIFTHGDFLSSNLGWPIAYVSDISNSTIKMSDSNDQCNLNVYSSEIDYVKIDLSGKPINSILEPDTNEKYFGFKYITDSLGQFLKDTLTGATGGAQLFEASQAVFPTGSYVYIPAKHIVDKNTFYFSDNNLSESNSFQDWAAVAYPDVLGSWIEENIKDGSKVYYHKALNGDFDYETDPAIQYNGLIYDGEWNPAGDQLKYDESTGKYARFNKIAIDALAKQIKEIYLD
nr:hypothetical protein [Acinetobacter sp. Marseille-Q1620]